MSHKLGITLTSPCGIVVFGLVPLDSLRYPGIGGLSEYKPTFKIFAIYTQFLVLQSTSL
jgi:hypothetical protein